MPNIKKYDCVQLCAERGLTYVREKNPHVWFIDPHGLHHKANRCDFAKCIHVGSIKTCLCSKEEYFLHKLKQRYPDRFDNLDFTRFKYHNATTLTDVVCKTHGAYQTKPNWLMNGAGCRKCAHEKGSIRKKSNLQEFIDKSQEVHRGYYEYHKTEYVDCRAKLTITCKEHGDFETVPYYHLQGTGCPICTTIGGYSRKEYVKTCPSGASVYLLKFESENEEFFKIGISKSVKSRVQDLRKESGCEVIVVGSLHFKDAGKAWDLEKKLHIQFKLNQYKPMCSFRGQTECFSLDINNVELIHRLFQ